MIPSHRRAQEAVGPLAFVVNEADEPAIRDALAAASKGQVLFVRRPDDVVFIPSPPSEDAWWCRPVGGIRASMIFYRVTVDLATKLCGVDGYQIRLGTADELLAAGFTLSALHSALRVP